MKTMSSFLPRVIEPNLSLMPYSQIMARAMAVARFKSFPAPVVTSPKVNSSAVRPPKRVVICAKARFWKTETGLRSGGTR